MERVVNDPYVPYINAFNLLLTALCLVAYTQTDGKELVLRFYVPLDVALNLSRISFYWYTFYQDKWQK